MPKPELNHVQPGDRVRLTADFVEHSSNPERQIAYRGVVVDAPRPDSSYTMVMWDGLNRPFPVLTRHLEHLACE
jgi:ribosomal protein L19